MSKHQLLKLGPDFGTVQCIVSFLGFVKFYSQYIPYFKNVLRLYVPSPKLTWIIPSPALLTDNTRTLDNTSLIDFSVTLVLLVIITKIVVTYSQNSPKRVSVMIFANPKTFWTLLQPWSVNSLVEPVDSSSLSLN